MKTLNLMLAIGAIVIAGFTSSFGQAVSDEAKRHFNRGLAAVEMAKSPADYEAAIAEFRQAVDLAPDWADAYFNLGKVQDQAEKFGDAIASFRQYLRLAPNASDAETVKGLIDKLQYKAENTLTKADIISVLTSLARKSSGGYKGVTSIWKNNGNCSNFALNYDRFITRKDEESIFVVSLVDIFMGEEMTYQVVKVDGPTVRFRWVTGQGSTIAEQFETQIDVLSRSRVKVRAVKIKGMRDFETLRGTGMIFECELSPPK